MLREIGSEAGLQPSAANNGVISRNASLLVNLLRSRALVTCCANNSFADGTKSLLLLVTSVLFGYSKSYCLLFIFVLELELLIKLELTLL